MDEKSKSSTSKFAHSVAPDFGVTNPMLSNPGTPSGLAAAIDQKNADNLQLIAEAKAAADAKVIQSSMDDEQSTLRARAHARSHDRTMRQRGREVHFFVRFWLR